MLISINNTEKYVELKLVNLEKETTQIVNITHENFGKLLEGQQNVECVESNDAEAETVTMRFFSPITSVMDNRLPDIAHLFSQRGYNVYYTDIANPNEYQQVGRYWTITVPVHKKYGSNESLQSLKSVCNMVVF